MHGEVAVHASELYGFLLVLARMAGVFTFLPLPGFKAGPDVAKIALALALTFGLYSRWPVIQPVSAEHSAATAPPTSSGVPGRPIGVQPSRNHVSIAS